MRPTFFFLTVNACFGNWSYPKYVPIVRKKQQLEEPQRSGSELERPTKEFWRKTSGCLKHSFQKITNISSKNYQHLNKKDNAVTAVEGARISLKTVYYLLDNLIIVFIFYFASFCAIKLYLWTLIKSLKITYSTLSNFMLNKNDCALLIRKNCLKMRNKTINRKQNFLPYSSKFVLSQGSWCLSFVIWCASLICLEAVIAYIRIHKVLIDWSCNKY